MMEKWIGGDMHPSYRILMGPGPSNVHYRVYQAMSNPIIGYLDPQILAFMDEISEMLRGIFQTKNLVTLAISGTGSSGMEASRPLRQGDGGTATFSRMTQEYGGMPDLTWKRRSSGSTAKRRRIT